MKRAFSLLIILLFTGLLIHASGQNINEVKISLKVENKNLKDVLSNIQERSGFSFIYNDKLISGYTHISLTAQNRTISSVLNEVLSQRNLKYQEQNHKIVITENNIVPVETLNPEKTPFTAIFQESLSISGTVTDEKGATMQGATVFISNSQKIALTDAAGKFTLRQMLPGTYEIVVKTLGFYPYNQTVVLKDKPQNITIKLKENTIGLEAVTVKAPPDPKRPVYMKLFMEYFIGKSSNAERCELTNPNAISFHFNKTANVLTAHSDEMLVIQNFDLGYKINYLLTSFTMDFKNNIFSYQGSPVFEELKGSASKQKQWEYNRRIAYLGSIRHFFKAAFNKTSATEGFLVYQLPGEEKFARFSKMARSFIKPINIDSILKIQDKNFKLLKLDPAAFDASKSHESDRLYVIYTKEGGSNEFVTSKANILFPLNIESKDNEVSMIRPLNSNIIVDKNGGLNPAKGFIYDGYWSWEKIADLMPLDYTLTPAP